MSVLLQQTTVATGITETYSGRTVLTLDQLQHSVEEYPSLLNKYIWYRQSICQIISEQPTRFVCMQLQEQQRCFLPKQDDGTTTCWIITNLETMVSPDRSHCLSYIRSTPRVLQHAMSARIYEGLLPFVAKFSSHICQYCGKVLTEGDTCAFCAQEIQSLLCSAISNRWMFPEDAIQTTRGLVHYEEAANGVVCSECGAIFDLSHGQQLMHGGVVHCPACQAALPHCAICNEAVAFDNVVHVPEFGLYAHKHCVEDRVVVDYHDNNSHSSPRFFGTPDASFPLYLGVELEVDSTLRVSAYPGFIPQIFQCTVLGPRFEFTRDGSLSSQGVEIISHPMDIVEWREQRPVMRRLLRGLIQIGMRGHDAETAGLHVHVSRDAFTTGKIEGTENIPEFGLETAVGRLGVLLYRFSLEVARLSRRTSSSKSQWAKTKSFGACSEQEIRRIRKEIMTGGSHGVELNVTEHTIEFRMFRSTLKLETFYAILAFVEGICRFVMDNPMSVCLNISFTDLLASIADADLTAYFERLSAVAIPFADGVENEQDQGE